LKGKRQLYNLACTIAPRYAAPGRHPLRDAKTLELTKPRLELRPLRIRNAVLRGKSRLDLSKRGRNVQFSLLVYTRS
jgi:hypothetical protein